MATEVGLWAAFDNNDHRNSVANAIGERAFREAVALAALSFVKMRLKAHLPVGYHADIDREWMRSTSPAHPLHGVKTQVHDALADLAQSIDNHHGKPVQTRLSFVAGTVLAKADIIARRAAESIQRPRR